MFCFPRLCTRINNKYATTVLLLRGEIMPLIIAKMDNRHKEKIELQKLEQKKNGLVDFECIVDNDVLEEFREYIEEIGCEYRSGTKYAGNRVMCTVYFG